MASVATEKGEAMRPIDGDALKGKLKKHHDFFVNAWGGFKNLPPDCKARVDEISSCIAEIVNAPTIDQYGTWIPCSEKPKREQYLKNDGRFIFTDCNRVYEGYYDMYDGKFKKHSMGKWLEDKCVTHWMPLPKPYREEKKDE